MKFVNKIKELRSKIPIGINRAMTILEENNGDIELSIEQFKKELVDILIAETGVDSSNANTILYKTNFNVNDAIKIINESRFSKTENILKKITTSENKSNFLYVVLVNEIKDYNDDTYMDKENFKKLPPAQKSFLILLEWIEYLEYEGLSYAIHSKLFEEVLSILDSSLNMPKLSSELKNAKKIEAQIRKEFDKGISTISNIEGYESFHDRLYNNEVFLRAEKLLWKEKEEKIYDSLVLYVEENLTFFP